MRIEWNRKALTRDRGQGMTEYIIVVALIAIASIAVTTMYGGNVRAVFGAATDAMTGDTNTTVNAQRADRLVNQRTTLGNFAKQP